MRMPIRPLAGANPQKFCETHSGHESKCSSDVVDGVEESFVENDPLSLVGVITRGGASTGSDARDPPHIWAKGMSARERGQGVVQRVRGQNPIR